MFQHFYSCKPSFLEDLKKERMKKKTLLNVLISLEKSASDFFDKLLNWQFWKVSCEGGGILVFIVLLAYTKKWRLRI